MDETGRTGRRQNVRERLRALARIRKIYCSGCLRAIGSEYEHVGGQQHGRRGQRGGQRVPAVRIRIPGARWKGHDTVYLLQKALKLHSEDETQSRWVGTWKAAVEGIPGECRTTDRRRTVFPRGLPHVLLYTPDRCPTVSCSSNNDSHIFSNNNNSSIRGWRYFWPATAALSCASGATRRRKPVPAARSVPRGDDTFPGTIYEAELPCYIPLLCTMSPPPGATSLDIYHAS